MMRFSMPVLSSLLAMALGAAPGCRSGGGAVGEDGGDPDGGSLDAAGDGLAAADGDAAEAGSGDGAVTDGSDSDGTTPDATVPDASSLAACSFNDDCPAWERCECDEATGCFCRIGERGTGRNGVDPCADGNDCESALCVEGADGSYFCSGECETEADCGPELPLCSSIAFVGRICVRTPPG